MKVASFLFLLSTITLSASLLSSDEASAYLSQLAASRPKKSATIVQFREVRTSKLLDKPVMSKGEIAFQASGQFRREVFGPNGSLMVSNGETLWIYYPATKEVERYRVKSGITDAFHGLMAAFNFQEVDRLFQFTVEWNGEVHRITFVPKRRTERRLFNKLMLEIGSDQKLRQAVWMSPEGEKTEMVFSGERWVKEIDFSFQVPAGTRVW